MRIIIALAGTALALSACGSGDRTTEANTMATDNLVIEDNLMMEPDATMNGTAGMDANASTNASTENMMMKDATTNDPDTNLANGL
ncbi:MAG TPA: hypothetical protein VE053_08625 [Allosphingosinicella sp.]|nr:hypothetical protein [Allosphingosinicella sp.]